MYLDKIDFQFVMEMRESDSFEKFSTAHEEKSIAGVDGCVKGYVEFVTNEFEKQSQAKGLVFKRDMLVRISENPFFKLAEVAGGALSFAAGALVLQTVIAGQAVSPGLAFAGAAIQSATGLMVAIERIFAEAPYQPRYTQFVSDLTDVTKDLRLNETSPN